MPALKSKLIIVIILGMFCWGCQSDRQQVDLKYFDSKSFLDNQAGVLALENRDLSKRLSIDGKEEIMTLQSSKDTAFWEDEFRLFQDLDINKPVLRDAYTITKGSTGDRGSYLQYELKDPNQFGVQQLKVEFDSLDGIITWEAQAHEKNVLYSTRRWARMELVRTAEGNLLKNYQVNGYHKLVLKDTVYYEVSGEINHN